MTKISFPQLEEEVLSWWEKHHIFHKTLSKDSPQGEFVFYEGPPTANGRPGIHHVLARAFKDLIPRYKTMRGYHVARKAGWDTHGLPVELEIEKELGISGKPEIEQYGIDEFNQKCKLSVWRYKSEWEKLTRRMGFWIDLEHPYITYENDYIETLWWIIKQVQRQGFLYRGYKVVPHCPRCGTALSSHEVAQGYKQVPDRSVYIKFKVIRGNEKIRDGDYILSWTTTPWTLPGNVALAVGEMFDYVRVKVDSGEVFILAKARLSVLTGEYEILDEMKGSDLIGLEYAPLFPGAIPLSVGNYSHAFKVYAADFVTTDDGTGVVHTAVMYGEDDYQLGEKIGLPRHHTVNEEGNFDFNASAAKYRENGILAKLQGRFVKDKETEDLIIQYLSDNSLLYKEEVYEHDYPFCWRCDTPLLYYAKNSWFIRISELREELKRNNETINWVPSHIKHGRFGEWLEGVKDWAISRERFWGTPLPVWYCSKCQTQEVVGSRQELFMRSAGQLTKVILIRHGESEKNIKNIHSSKADKYSLTPVGEKQAEMYGYLLKEENVDVFYSSPLLRTKQTAEIVSSKIGIPVEYVDALRENSLGDWEEIDLGKLGKEDSRYIKFKEMRRSGDLAAFDFIPPGGESLKEVQERLNNWLVEVLKNNQGKTILICTHELIISFFIAWVRDLSAEETLAITNTEAVEVGGKPLVFYLADNFKELDLHRPYIDRVRLVCSKCQSLMQRDPAVLDCWFDSGSMPFAQIHYPFASEFLSSPREIEGGVDDLIPEIKSDYYPADFICEAIDQTRGWFYTLLAVSTLLKQGAAYRNVICLGHVNDKYGKKMSKSKGNVVDPWEIINKYGVDALRLHFYSMNQPGEPKNFDPTQVEEVMKKNFLVLWNVLSFYKLYRRDVGRLKVGDSSHILDKWIRAKMHQLIETVTKKLDSYDITAAARALILFINELSTWYLRRSRQRFKDKNTREEAVFTLGRVLFDLARLLAPFTPFVAEKLYQELKERGEILAIEYQESVHLEEWPEIIPLSAEEKSILKQMEEVRNIVERALALRAEAGIKVRQPLATLYINSKNLDQALLDIIKDEINVKEVQVGEEIKLDTTITPELREEGIIRELVRHINDLRKRSGLTIDDQIEVEIAGADKEVKTAIINHEDELKQAVLASKITQVKILSLTTNKEIKVDGNNIVIGLNKIS